MAVLFRDHWASVLRVALAAIASTVSTIFGVYALSYAVDTKGLDQTTMLWVAIATNVVALAAIPAWAILSDRIGRKPVFIFGAIGSGALMFAYLAAIASGSYPLIFLAAILMSGVVYSAMNGIQPSLYGEMFPTRVRLSGMAIGTQIGFAIGGFAPTAAAALAGDGPDGWVPVAVYVLASSLLAAIAVATARETYKLPLRDDRRAHRALRATPERCARTDRGGRAGAGAAYDGWVVESTATGRQRDAERTRARDPRRRDARVRRSRLRRRARGRDRRADSNHEADDLLLLRQQGAALRGGARGAYADPRGRAGARRRPPRSTAAIRRLAELTFDHHESHPDFIRLVTIENIHRAEHMAELTTIQRAEHARRSS